MFFLIFALSSKIKAQNFLQKENLIPVLENIWLTEQAPISNRDSLMDIYGLDSKEVQVYQEIYREKHAVNEQTVTDFLDRFDWPRKELIGLGGI
ncbi:hypothetical protein [Algoriphagus sp.]|uniref:hypothetical protein n=1 Tax=Algoriphagus sp. TaxID=1872435 RepID=UPI0025D4D654|nr:hypothetical protein [Algoriphagus sp.]